MFCGTSGDKAMTIDGIMFAWSERSEMAAEDLEALNPIGVDLDQKVI